MRAPSERPDSVIVAGARTPMGRLLGSLKDLPRADLGGVAIKAALERAGVAPDQVDYVIMGQVIQAGAGQITGAAGRGQGRHPDGRPGADDQQGLPVRPRRDRAGRPADPRRRVRDRRRRRHGVDDARRRTCCPGRARASSTATSTLVDSMALRRALLRVRPDRDGRAHRARTTTRYRRHAARSRTRSRPRSHQRAAAAQKNGVFDEEIAPVDDPAAQGRPGRGHARTRASAATRLPSRSAGCARRSRKDGTITAGSSSQISDGAAAVVVMSKAKAEELGLTWLAEIGAHGVVAGPGRLAARAAGQRDPAGAARARASTSADLDLVEINEAFAAVGLVSTRDARRRPTDKVNVNGGAIALGHPVGMSGARIVLHLALELRAARWRRRRGRAVRRRRPGRRPARPRARRPEPVRCRAADRGPDDARRAAPARGRPACRRAADLAASRTARRWCPS